MNNDSHTEVAGTAEPDGDTATTRCVHCDAEADASWAFCGTCGKPLDAQIMSDATPLPETREAAGLSIMDPAAPPTSTAPAATNVLSPPNAGKKPPPHRRSPLKITLYSLALVLLLALIASAGYVYQQTVNDLENTRAELATTQDQLETTSATLSDTEQSLADSQQDLSNLAGVLQKTKSRLQSANQELSGLRGSLDSAEDRLDLQANQIETLKTCLDGVTNAMAYAAYDNYGAAIASLDAVEVSCNRAYELF